MRLVAYYAKFNVTSRPANPLVGAEVGPTGGFAGRTVEEEWLLGKGVKKWISRIAIAIVADEGGVAAAATTAMNAGIVYVARADSAGATTNVKRC
jgi:hypothetical protein